MSHLLKFVLFADDSTTWASAENLQQLLELTTIEINKVKKWCNKQIILKFGKY